MIRALTPSVLVATLLFAPASDAQQLDFNQLEATDAEFRAMIDFLARRGYFTVYERALHEAVDKIYLISGAPVEPRPAMAPDERFRGRQPAGVLVTSVLYENPPGRYTLERAIVYAEREGERINITCQLHISSREVCAAYLNLRTNELTVIRLDLLWNYWGARGDRPPEQRCLAEVTRAERERHRVGDRDVYGRFKVHLIALHRCRESRVGT